MESQWVQDEVPVMEGAGQELCGEDLEALRTRATSRL